ncbi:MAG: TrmH family RNA methyltransferase [Acidimicrobiia bacterium]|nr:TrmH family RNA methyltransferase [Acidimicrobiia bacterium]
MVVEGFHALKHAIRFGARLREVACSDAGTLEALAGDLAPDVTETLEEAATVVGPDVFSRLAPRPHPTGVVAVADRPSPGRALERRRGRVVVLERPRRPNNVGASVRVAAAAGAAGVVVVDGADPWHPEAVRTGAGLQFALDVTLVPAFPPTPLTVVAMDPDGDPTLDVPADAAICFGTEREGLSAALRDRADRVVALPMRSGVSSLNLATAVAATLYRRPGAMPPAPD